MRDVTQPISIASICGDFAQKQSLAKPDGVVPAGGPHAVPGVGIVTSVQGR
jgi:hypothetical protein